MRQRKQDLLADHLKFRAYVEFIAPSRQASPNSSVPDVHAHLYLEVAASTQSPRGLLLIFQKEEVNEYIIRSLSTIGTMSSSNR
jgi:hypothetical protein